MKQTRLVLLGLSMAAITAGCAATPEVVPATPTPAPTLTLIQQTGYGSAARFAPCEVTDCPVRTVKTLAHLERAALK